MKVHALKVLYTWMGSSPAYVIGLHPGAICTAMGHAKPRQSRESGHSEHTIGFKDKAAARAGSIQKQNGIPAAGSQGKCPQPFTVMKH